MTAGERSAIEGYFTALFEDEDSDESDNEYVPRDFWKRVRLYYIVNVHVYMHTLCVFSGILVYVY